MNSDRRNLILMCGLAQPSGLLWAADRDDVPAVTDATTCLPDGWRYLGATTSLGMHFDQCGELERIQPVMESIQPSGVRGLRVGSRLTLVLDEIDGARHDRIWLPSTVLVAPGEFAIYPDRDGQRVHLFTHVLEPASLMARLLGVSP